MKRYKKYIMPYLAAFIFGPIMMLTEVLGEILIPRFMSMIINNGVADHDVGYILRIGLIMIVTCCFMVVGGVLGCYFSAKASIGFSGDLRKDLFDKVQTFSFADIDNFSTGSLVTRLTNDVQQVQNFIALILRGAMRSPGLIIGALAMALTINAQLAVIFLIVLPVLAFSIFMIMSTAYPRFQSMQKSLDKLNTTLQEALTNVRVVKSFVREEHEEEKFNAKSNDLREKTISAMLMVAMTLPVMSLAMNITTVAVVWFGGCKVIAGTMQVGDLTAFITYVTQILVSLMMIAMIILQSSRATASFARIDEVLTAETDITDAAAASPDRLVEHGSIEFRNVTFSYPGSAGDPVLENISFTVNAGETIGILGSTGCGKTSLVQLIPRLYDVSAGEVLVDGVNVKDYSLYNLREGVGMVLQYNTLFSGTISENLRWGNEQASDEEVDEAAASAQADSFIQGFADGYERMIDQGGTNVSGGQKQRLCIARALLKKPKILILDDSTSAVDTATEARIREAFATTLKDTTKLIIAQRIGSVKEADRIIVMDDGRIADIGTHSELISRCEEYREIYYSQVDRKEEEGA